MSLTTILNTILLCALAAAAFDSITPIKFSEMDPFGPEAYSNAYASHLNRHGSRSLFSGAPAAMRTGASTSSTMMTGEKAEMIIYKLASEMFWALFKYSLYAFLMWSAICFLPWRRMLWAFGEWVEATARAIAPQMRAGLRGWLDLFVLLLIHIFRAITQNRWVLHARWAIGDRLVRTWRAFLHVSDNIRHHWVWDTIYLHYQLIVNWLGGRKLHLIVFIVGIHVLSTVFRGENNENQEVFMKWSDLQRYIDTPIPEYLFRQRLEYGSNCHYHWAEPGLGSPISATPLATMPFEEAILQSAGVGRTESEQNEPGLVVEISTTPTTKMPPEEATEPLNPVRETESEQTRPGLAERISTWLTPTMLLEEDALPSTEVHETEKRQKLPGEKIAFCRHCRQEHCCEVYI